MRTGATFARGSCKALRWLVLAGMVFALGAASAVAQAPRLGPPEAISGTMVKLEWTLPAGPALVGPFFKTQHAPTESFSETTTTKTPLDSAGIGTTEVELAVMPGVEYTFRVAAVTSTGDNWSNTVTFTSENPPPVPRTPGTGTGLKVDVGDKTVKLTWAPGLRTSQVGVERYFEYNYWLSDSNIDETKWEVVPGGASATSVDVIGLTNGEIYQFRVRAVNNGGASGPLPGTGTPSTVPGAPTGLLVRLGPSISGKVIVTLEWIPPADDGGTPITSFGYEVVGLPGFPIRIAQSDLATVAIPDLEADKAAGYTYKVWAENERGAGQATTKTGAGGGGATPTGLTFTPASQPNLGVPAGTHTSHTLPMATGGTGAITYSISARPNGLTFDSATRMLSGTPTTPAATTVTYTAMDSATPPVTGSLTFTITVTPAGTAPGTGTGTAPAFSSAGFKPGSADVTITMSEPVWGGGKRGAGHQLRDTGRRRERCDEPHGVHGRERCHRYVHRHLQRTVLDGIAADGSLYNAGYKRRRPHRRRG